MQDEDNSSEQAAALASPIKGSKSHKMNQVHYSISDLNEYSLQITQRSSLNITILQRAVPSPVGTVKIYNNDVVPSWLAQVMSTKDYWPNINDYLDRLQSTWDKYLGEEYPHKINKNTDAYQKVYTI